MDDALRQDLASFSNSLRSLGYTEQADSVDAVLVAAAPPVSQKRALLERAHWKLNALRAQLGDENPHNPILARISFELEQELRETP